MNRTQALKELQLLENYELDRADAPGRLLVHLASNDPEVLLTALRASTGYFGLPGIWEKVFELACGSAEEEIRAIANASLWPVMQDGSGWDWLPGEDEDIDPEVPMPPEPMVPREIYEATKVHLMSRVDAHMESMDVRRRCLEALGHIAFLPEVRATVMRFYSEAPNVWVKVSSIYAMGLSEDDEFERIVVEELGSSQPPVVSEAIHACANLRLEEAWPQVQLLVEHEDEDVRFEALAATGMLVPLAEAEATMEQLLSEFRDARSRDALRIAAAALEERRQEDSGEDEAWRMDQVRDEIDRMTDTRGDEA